MRSALLAIAATLLAPSPAQVLPPQIRPGGSRVLALEVQGRFKAQAFRMFGPGCFVVDLDQACLQGQPLAVDALPGTPIRGVRVFQLKDQTVRAYVDLADPRRLRCRIVQASAERARVEIWLPEPAHVRQADAKHGPALAAAAGTTVSVAVADAEVARGRPLLPVLTPLTRPANPLEGALPDAVRGLAATSLLARTFGRATLPAEAVERAARQALGGFRLGGRDPLWQWRTSSQALYTSNVAEFERGAAAAGTRQRLMGFSFVPVPLAHGALVAHVDHQALRFTDPRYDYQALLGSVALAHPLAPHLHWFEGGALLDRQPVGATDLALLDTSLYTGLGVFGNLGPQAAWSATVTAERVAASDIRQSYYGQALKLRLQQQLGTLGTLQGQASLQRIDPVVRTTPYFRGYLEGSVERLLLAGVRAGMQGQVGLETGVQGQQSYVVAGPYVQVAF